MNQDHAIGAAVAGGPSVAVLLATVLQHFQAVDTATASAEAGLLVLALGALAGLPALLLAEKPRATALLGEAMQFGVSSLAPVVTVPASPPPVVAVGQTPAAPVVAVPAETAPVA